MLNTLIRKLFDIAHYFRKLYWRIFKIKTFGARAMLVEDGKVFLVQHRYGNLWVFPGGGVKKGESSEEVAGRETIEEVNIEVNGFSKKLGVYKNTKEGKNDTVSIFVSEDFKDLGRKKNFEIKESGWFSINDLPENTSSATKKRVSEYLKGEENVEAEW
jgi:8-oxo-dGTP pyrophosphatase MutT (NUDIX family)